MQPANDALHFKMSVTVVWLFRFTTVFGSGFMALCFSLPIMDPSVKSVVIALAGILIFGALAAYSWSAQGRARDQIAVDETGIWRLSPKGPPLFVAWGNVGLVRADDTMQRLIVSDRSHTHAIRLEYQLEQFSALRDYVLKHTAPSTRTNSTTGSLFHRTWINKSIMLFFAMFSLAVAVPVYSQSGLKSSMFFIVFAGFSLVNFARDPSSLSIKSDRLIIGYPGWRREIPFSDIASVNLGDESNRGNVWAVVVIALKGRKPIKLYRFREGSLALIQALRGALGAAP